MKIEVLYQPIPGEEHRPHFASNWQWGSEIDTTFYLPGLIFLSDANKLTTDTQSQTVHLVVCANVFEATNT